METLAVKASQLQVAFGAKEVLCVEELTIYQNERIGIVGANGQGKSTLLNVLAGKQALESGTIDRKIDFHYFPQIAALPQEMPTDIDFEWLSRFSMAQQDDFFSGGEITKLRLAQIFAQYKQGLLLDEPTTHLDQESIALLIEELRYYYGTLIFVSHHRHFLNALAEKIWEVNNGKITEYVGNYDAYVRQVEQQKLEQMRQAENYSREKARLTRSIEKKKEQAARMTKTTAQKKKANRPDRLSSSKQKDTVQKAVQKTAKTMEKRLAMLTEVTVVQAAPRIVFPKSKETELHNPYPIRGEAVSIRKGEKTLLTQADFQFKLGKRIALVGKNGSGKTSLLQHILTRQQGIVVSPKVQFAVYQQMDDKMQQEEAILPFLMKQTTFPEAVVRSMLHHLGFCQNELEKPLVKLSGGEATRLSLALLFSKPSNVLILDEPTNFIDLKTIEALEIFLQAYPGTVLFTSHDAVFVKNVAEEVYEIAHRTLQKIK